MPGSEYTNSGTAVPRTAATHRVYPLRATVATAVGCYRPGARLALVDGELYRSRDTRLLEGHRRHATVAIERLK
jgi:hypothetical protein